MTHRDRPARSALGIAGASWGVVGVLWMLVEAIVRLVPVTVEALRHPGMGAFEWWSVVGWCAGMGYAEGYRGFQRAFSPRVVVRALAIAARPRWLDVVLAPVYCMALYRAPRRRIVANWLLLVGIVGLIQFVRRLEQPYRGIVDAGVVMGLAWGTVAIAAYTWQALRGRPLPDV